MPLDSFKSSACFDSFSRTSIAFWAGSAKDAMVETLATATLILTLALPAAGTESRLDVQPEN